jgi:flagellar protein FlaJ
MKGVAEIGNKIKEDQVIVIDLLDTLTYMAAISTAYISRDQIFEFASERKGITAQHLKKVMLLAKNFSFEYSKACRLVAEQCTQPMLKEFLMLLSNAISSGEREEDFLRGEVERMIEMFTNKYLGDIEVMRKWADAYCAMLVSVSMVLAITLISTTLFSLGDPYTTLTLLTVFLCFIGLMGDYVIYRSAPYDLIDHSLEIRSKEQEIMEKMSRFILPALGISAIILIIIDVEPWIISLSVGALLAPIGITAFKDNKRIEKLDMVITPFVKSLGATAGTTRVTLSSALSFLDEKSVGPLEEYIKRLRKRLISGLKPEICWLNFIGETGSELIHKSTRVFLDAIELGGDPTRIGETVSKSSLGLVLLRSKRKLVSAGFANLVIPLHVVMCAVIIFIYGITYAFTNSIADLMAEQSMGAGALASSMPMGFTMFGAGTGLDFGIIENFVVIVVMVLTFSNACASKFAAGGSNYLICFYASILFFISGVVLYAVPIMVGYIFIM